MRRAPRASEVRHWPPKKEACCFCDEPSSLTTHCYSILLLPTGPFSIHSRPWPYVLCCRLPVIPPRERRAMASTRASQLPQQILRARYPHPAYTRSSNPSRYFSSSRTCHEQFHRKESFRSRLNSALKNTKVKWEPIPIALGIGFLGVWQMYRIQRREKHTESGEATDQNGRPKPRERIRPSGPW